MSVEIKALAGEAFDAAIPYLARLRTVIFRQWPYLYDGDMDYEEKYLARFRNAERAFLAVAVNGDAIVGAATAAPLTGETQEFRAPFEAVGHDVARIFYFAESLLLPEYRGQGIGHGFFNAREAHAKSFGEYTYAAFCGVVRPENHPARPHSYSPLDAFWQKRGFEKQDGLIAHFSWKDLGDAQETEKPMQFWMKQL